MTNNTNSELVETYMLECDTLDVLRRAYSKNNLVILFGAGISFGGGCPEVGTITKMIIEVLLEKGGFKFSTDEITEIKDKAEKMQFELFMQHVYEILGDNVTQEILEVFFVSDYSHSPIHRYLVNLKNTEFITVNMDTLFENYFKDSDKGAPEIVVKEKDYDYKEVKAKNSPLLVKLHGSIDTDDTYVATVFSEGKLPDYKKKFLLDMLKGKVLWLIGYSMNDYDVSYLLIKSAVENNLPCEKIVYHCYDIKSKNIERLNNELNGSCKLLFSKGCVEKYLIALSQEASKGINKRFDGNGKKEVLKNIIDKRSDVLISTLGAKIINALDDVDPKIIEKTYQTLYEINRKKPEINRARMDLMHQIAQMRAAYGPNGYRRELWKKVAEGCSDIINDSIDKNEEDQIRVKVLRIEAKRHLHSTKRDNIGKGTEIEKKAVFNDLFDKFNTLVNEARYRKEEYENTNYSEFFKCIYYRCLNERAKFILFFGRKHIEQHKSCFEYLDVFKASDGRDFTSELQVNGTALCISSVLHEHEAEEFRKDAKLMFDLDGRTSYDETMNTIQIPSI